MAEAVNSNALATASGFEGGLKENTIFRQLSVMVGIAASVALGVAVVLWSQEPSYAPLYGNLAERDASQVLDALQKTGTQYKVDNATGMILVPNGKVKELRMKLASDGLPNGDGLGFELMQQEMGFGTSLIVEKARYQQAMQGELARTISTIGAVKSARVHLAIPKQSVFVRKRKQPSASVTLKLFSGRKLEPAQIEAIVHLVASSVPELESSKVTVVDQKGHLLSGAKGDEMATRSNSQFEYARKIEEHYQNRIEALLEPILGADGIRAQVSADIDFTTTEQTQERFNPDQPSLRSEQVSEENSRSGSVGGVPGALSNQPPAAGAAPEEAGAADANSAQAGNSSRNSTRNFELDRVLSHTRKASNVLRRLSVAVVVNDIFITDAEGKVSHQERSPEEMERLTQLVREAVGFNVRRGDSVKVINSVFQTPELVESLPEVPMWEQAWFWDVLKQSGGVLLVLILIFVVLKPTLNKLTSPTQLAVAGAAGGAIVEGPLGADGQPVSGGGGLLVGSDGEPIKLAGGGDYENIMDAARQLVDEDPKRVAQLVKNWVAEDAA